MRKSRASSSSDDSSGGGSTNRALSLTGSSSSSSSSASSAIPASPRGKEGKERRSSRIGSLWRRKGSTLAIEDESYGVIEEGDLFSPAEIEQMALTMAMDPMAGGLPLRNRKYHLKTYRQCFEVEEFIAWVTAYGRRTFQREVTREEAVRIGQQLHRNKVIVHVVDKKKPFMEGYFFWRFTPEFMQNARYPPTRTDTTKSGALNLFMPAMPPCGNGQALPDSQNGADSTETGRTDELYLYVDAESLLPEASQYVINTPNVPPTQPKQTENFYVDLQASGKSQHTRKPEDSYYTDVVNLVGENDESLLASASTAEEGKDDLTIYTGMDDSDSEDESNGSLFEFPTTQSNTRSLLLEKNKTGIPWNQRFQDYLARLGSDDAVPSELYSLQNDFVCAATTYARIIISEINLPPDQRTIEAIGIGGLAGGKKYIKNGILFKFALDTKLKVPDGRGGWMYGWDAPSHKNAGKAAGRELNGIQSMFVTFTPKLHYPLMCVVDHCGYRLIAVAMLPISSSTIRYGSGDGGKTVHADIPELNEAMAEACKQLGLCGHRVKDKVIYGPGDIEAHLGSDGRYYVLDFARLLPPESPPDDPAERQADPRSVFYKLLRPEFVFSYKQKFDKYLCSDAFTAWGMLDPRAIAMCHDVTDATHYLYNTVIPEYARKLETSKLATEYCGFIQTSAQDVVHGFQMALDLLDRFVMGITSDLHASGCNIRHLGRVRLLLQQSELRRLLLSLCVARVVKNNIREQMRALTSTQEGGSPTEEPYKRIIYSNLNHLLGGKGSEDHSHKYWTHGIKKELRSQFRLVLTEEEKAKTTDLRECMEMKIFFLYLSKIVGVEIDTKAIKALWKGLCESAASETSFVFLQSDILVVRPWVKKAFFASLAAGIQAGKEAKQYASSGPDEPATRRNVMRQLNHARKMLREAHIMVPSCPVVNLQYGISIAEIALRKSAARRDALFDSAYERFEASLAIKPLRVTYTTYAQMLRSHAAIKRARSQVDEALKLEERATELEAKLAEDEEVDAPGPQCSPLPLE